MSGIRDAGLRDRETGNASPELVIQAEVGGVTIAFTELVNGDEAKLRGRVEMYLRTVDFARAKQMLVEALIDLESRRETLNGWGASRDAAIKKLVEDRTRARATFVAGGRSDRLTGAQQKTLDNFDAQIEQERAKWDQHKAKIEEEIPRYAAQVARQRAILAGRDRSEVIGFDVDAEAAE
jgi:hypothetical protein